MRRWRPFLKNWMEMFSWSMQPPSHNRAWSLSQATHHGSASRGTANLFPFNQRIPVLGWTRVNCRRIVLPHSPSPLTPLPQGDGDLYLQVILLKTIISVSNSMKTATSHESSISKPTAKCLLPTRLGINSRHLRTDPKIGTRGILKFSTMTRCISPNQPHP